MRTDVCADRCMCTCGQMCADKSWVRTDVYADRSWVRTDVCADRGYMTGEHVINGCVACEHAYHNHHHLSCIPQPPTLTYIPQPPPPLMHTTATAPLMHTTATTTSHACHSHPLSCQRYWTLAIAHITFGKHDRACQRLATCNKSYQLH